MHLVKANKISESSKIASCNLLYYLGKKFFLKKAQYMAFFPLIMLQI